MTETPVRLLIEVNKLEHVNLPFTAPFIAFQPITATDSLFKLHGVILKPELFIFGLGDSIVCLGK